LRSTNLFLASASLRITLLNVLLVPAIVVLVEILFGVRD
jgi:hypothetical protein